MLRTLVAYALPPLFSILAAIGAGQVQLFPPGSPWNMVAVALAAALGGAIGLRVHPNGLNGPPKVNGGPRPTLLLVLVLAAGVAQAQDQAAPASSPRLGAAEQGTSPPFGGCNAKGTVCAGPTVSLSLVGLDLRSGELVTGIMPGAGYQVTFMADKWHSLGVGGYAAIQTGTGSTPASGLFSVIGSFAQYLRTGIGVRLDGHSSRALWLLGLGMDFGP
jgi:hypothetical protein